MKHLFATVFALLSLPHLSAAQVLSAATDITAAEVQAFLKQLPRDATSDLPIRVVDVGGYRVGVYGVFRPKAAPGPAVFHETRLAEIYYMLEGGGTLVTGGTLKPPTTRDKSATVSTVMMNNRSTAGVNGGMTRHMGKGDMVIIPPSVVHQWTSLDADTTYLIIRTDPANEQPLK